MEEVKNQQALFGKVSVVKKIKPKLEEGKSSKVWELVSDDSEVIEVPLFEEGTEPAHVSVQMEYTKQVRDYEPVKVSVFVSMPCHANESELHRTYGIVQSIVSEKMSEAKRALSGAVKQ